MLTQCNLPHATIVLFGIPNGYVYGHFYTLILACKIYSLPSWTLESTPWAHTKAFIVSRTHTNVAHYLSPLATITKRQSRTNKDSGKIECQWKEGFYSSGAWIRIEYKRFLCFKKHAQPCEPNMVPTFQDNLNNIQTLAVAF